MTFDTVTLYILFPNYGSDLWHSEFLPYGGWIRPWWQAFSLTDTVTCVEFLQACCCWRNSSSPWAQYVEVLPYVLRTRECGGRRWRRIFLSISRVFSFSHCSLEAAEAKTLIDWQKVGSGFDHRLTNLSVHYKHHLSINNIFAGLIADRLGDDGI